MNLARLSKTLQETLLKNDKLSLSNSEVTLIAGLGNEKDELVIEHLGVLESTTTTGDGDEGMVMVV